MKKPEDQIEVNGDDVDFVYPVLFGGSLIGYQLRQKGQTSENAPQVRITTHVLTKLVKKFLKGKKFAAKKSRKYFYIEA